MRIVFCFIALLSLSKISFSQEVIFCESVDKSGVPKNASHEFTIGKEGGFFKILVKLNRKINSRKVVFDLYRLENGKESLDNTLRIDVDPDITWFYKEITIYKTGDFNVYVYDARDKLLGVGKVKVK